MIECLDTNCENGCCCVECDDWKSQVVTCCCPIAKSLAFDKEDILKFCQFADE